MQLNIKNSETYDLAATLARMTGESLTQAVTKAIAERLERLERRYKHNREGLAERLMAIAAESRQQPPLDSRTPEEILYDHNGLPKKRTE